VPIQVKSILVPLDHSAGSDAVVEYACVIARSMGAGVTLLHVYEPPNALVGIVPGATVAGELDAERSAGDTVLDHALAIARANGVTTTDRILERAAPAHQAIVAHASQGKFDLIIMGTHARSGVSRLVMGSVAEQVLRSAPCPLLLVHLPRG
jgi:nucleotide-binding universal stress UspA family protein